MDRFPDEPRVALIPLRQTASGRVRLGCSLALFALLSPILLFLPTASFQQQGRVLHANQADSTCQGQTPCYATIQAALDAAQAGDTIRIQPGTYVEQVTITGKNNVSGAAEADRIILEADSSAPLGSVVLRGAAHQCTNGYAIRLQQSKFITIRGLTITGAGGQAISLLGGNNQNQAIHLERNRIFGNGSGDCDGGITIARGNPDTLIVNNLIYGNGRNGISFLDADGGPHYLIQNTIFANGWSGVSIARNHEVSLVNNLITGNGTAAGSTGGRFGVKREDSTSPHPERIHLLHNLLCGNRLGEISGPALDPSDANNLTPTGKEGSGVLASPGCESPATVFARLKGADDLPNTADDDGTLAEGSLAIDRGLDPCTLGFDPGFNALFEADYASPAVRPRVGTGPGTAAFDIGAREFVAPNRPPVAHAGSDRSMNEGSLITLDGSGSSDPDGDALTFEWTQSAGPVVALLDATAASPTFTAPQVSASTPLTFQLRVSDGWLDSTATVTITVLDLPLANRAPVLDPIRNRTISVGGSLSFTVTASDPDGDPLTYSVSPLPLPANATFDAGRHIFNFTPAATQAGVFSLTITVTDGRGGTAAETIALTVLPPPPQLSGFSPLAGVVGTTVTLTGANLNTATLVTFNGRTAAFSVLSVTQLSATVPAGATSGPIVVTTPGGSIASLAPFTVLLPPTLTITSPANGATLSASSIQVRGTVNGATSEIGVSVNGLPAFVNSSQWVVEVPVVVGSNSLEARATDALGGSSSVRITITVSPAASPALRLLATPESGVAPLTVTWQVLNQTGQKLVQFEFDPIGSGSFESPGPTLDGTRTTYTTLGLFAATLRATDDKGTQYSTSTTVNVLARDQMDALLRGKWAGMKAALTAGDIEGGLLYFTSWQRPRYRTLFMGLSGQLTQIVQEMQDIQLVYLVESRAKYRLRRMQLYGGQMVTLTYYVYFIQDATGRWYIEEF